MDINDQTDAFLFEIQNVVNRFRAEYDLNHATIVGVLEVVKLDYLTFSETTIEFEAEEDENDDENSNN